MDVGDLIVGFTDDGRVDVRFGCSQYPDRFPLPPVRHVTFFISRQLNNLPRGEAARAVEMLEACIDGFSPSTAPELPRLAERVMGCSLVEIPLIPRSSNEFLQAPQYRRAFLGHLVAGTDGTWLGIELKARGFGILPGRVIEPARKSVVAVYAAGVLAVTRLTRFSDTLATALQAALSKANGTDESPELPEADSGLDERYSAFACSAIALAIQSVLVFWHEGQLSLTNEVEVNRVAMSVAAPLMEGALAFRDATGPPQDA